MFHLHNQLSDSLKNQHKLKYTIFYYFCRTLALASSKFKKEIFIIYAAHAFEIIMKINEVFFIYPFENTN